MRYAVIKPRNNGIVSTNAFVENVIVGDFTPGDKQAMEQALDAILMDAAPLGMAVGDLYNGAAWTRNVEGSQVSLPIVEPNPDVDYILQILYGDVV